MVEEGRTETRLVVVEDNLLVREGLVSLLDTTVGFVVVEVCASLDEGRAAIEAHVPDVVMTDIRMPPKHATEGIQLADETRKTYPDIGVLVLSQFVEPAYAIAVLGNGVRGRGYLLKDNVDEGGQLFAAIEAVANGRSFMDDDVVDALVRGRTQVADSPLALLSDRETEVLAEIATGATNSIIAERLYVSVNAIEKHSSSIFSKLGLTESDKINRRVAAVLMFLSGQEVAA